MVVEVCYLSKEYTTFLQRLITRQKKHISLLIILNDNVLILIWRNIKRTFYSANHKAPKILFMSFACNFAMVSKQTLTHWINHELKYVYDELYFFSNEEAAHILKILKRDPTITTTKAIFDRLHTHLYFFSNIIITLSRKHNPL